MWRIIKTELSYNKLLISMMLILSFAANFLYVKYTGREINYITWLFGYLIVLLMITWMNKEKRERLNALLPVSTNILGMSRALLILIPFAGVFATVFSVDLITGMDSFLYTKVSLGTTGLFVLGFSIYLVVRDLYLSKSKISKGQNRGIIIGLAIYFNKRQR